MLFSKIEIVAEFGQTNKQDKQMVSDKWCRTNWNIEMVEHVYIGMHAYQALKGLVQSTLGGVELMKGGVEWKKGGVEWRKGELCNC